MKAITKVLLIVGLLVGLGQSYVNGQNEKFFSSDREISSNLCISLYQDRKGFVWIATEDGLNKFDGIRFTTYHNLYDRDNEIKSNYALALHEDTFGRFWIGCSSGLQLYHRSTNDFQNVNIYDGNNKVYPYVNCIIGCSNKEVWMTTMGNGIIIVRPNTPTNRLTTASHLNHLLGDNRFTRLFEDSRKRIWICSQSHGIFCYHLTTNKVERVNTQKQLINEATGICEDMQGNIFVSTRTKGLYRLGRNDKSFSLVPYKQGYNSIKIVSLLNARDSHTMLVGTDGQGMKEFNYTTKELVNSQPKMTMFDFSKAKIHCMMKDRDNNLWLGLFQKGVLLQSGSVTPFDYYGYKSINHNCIGSCCVLSIFVDKAKNMWVGTDNDGIYAINKDGKQLKHFKNVANNPHTVPGTIECIYEDSNHDLWVGSFLGGVGKVNKSTGVFSPIYDIYKLNPQESSKNVSCMVEDNDKNLWFGTFGSGLFKRNLKTGVTTMFRINSKTLNSIPQEWINCLMKDRNGNIWIGTYLGLACYNTHKKSFITPNKRNVYFNGIGIFSLYEDKVGNIWIGTVKGLFRFSPHTQSYKHYTIADGLPSNTICGIEEDEHQNLWISTHRGIAKLIKSKNIFYNYNTSDGIQGSEFWYMASHKDDNGRIYFGGNNGITAFNPNEIINKTKKMDVVLTDFYISGRKIKISDLQGDVSSVNSINDLKEIRITHNDNTFSLELSTLEYINPERICYKYRILELGKEWYTTMAGINTITYNELPPGTYTFQVQAINLNDVSKVKTIIIHIAPPWYATWWAYCIWTLLIISLCCYLYLSAKTSLRQKQELMEKKNAEQISEAKLQFFMNLSHELRTPITLITSPLEKLLSEPSKNHEIYKLIYRNAQRILNLVNQLLDIRKIDKGYMSIHFEETDFIPFINDAMTVFNYHANSHNIQLTFEHAMPELKAWIDVNQFDKVLINLLSNAFKYTAEAGHINIKLELTHTTEGNEIVQLSVEDTGIGIDEDKTKLIFERFYQINNLQTNINFGTGIGLHLSKLLVEMHHGTIRAERRMDVEHGSRFIIRIPRCNHNDNENQVTTDASSKPQIATPYQSANKGEWMEETEKQEDSFDEFSKKKPNILIVEDEKDIRVYLRSELSSDFNITSCKNGKEALTFILKNEIDLVISDVMMPEMDGIELCKAIKKNSNTYYIPVILLTARSTIENKLEGLEIGADAYIEKPFNMTLLKGSIINLINNRNLIRRRKNSEDKIDSNINTIELKSNDELIMERIMSTIDENLSNPDLNVDMLATNVGLSRAHLYRKLKEMSDQPVKIFIRDIRLKQAAKLLKKHSYSISEVAYAVGFTNVNYFTSVFKEYYGMTPKEYKNNN